MLTELKIKNTKPAQKDYKVYDTCGLYLIITTSGSRLWRIDYRYKGKRKSLSLGRYPEISLKTARSSRDQIKKDLATGIDPSEKRKMENQPHIFNEIAEKWLTSISPKWKESYRVTITGRLNLYIKETIGKKDIKDITRIEILNLLKAVENSGKVDSAHKLKTIISSIFKYAIDLEIIDRDPSIRIGKHLRPLRPQHYPTILNIDDIRNLALAIDIYPNPNLKNALKMLMLTFVRPGELRMAKWEEVNLKECIWDIPAERTKTNKPHRVFLPKQTISILNELKTLYGREGYIFKGRAKDKCLSEIALNVALKVMGYDTKRDITAHGFRAMARTLLHEKIGYAPEVIEHQLGHKVPDILGEAYNRTKFYEQRKAMMQDWADFIDRIKGQTT